MVERIAVGELGASPSMQPSEGLPSDARLEGLALNSLDNEPDCDPRAARERGDLLSFGDVEEALIEAVRCSWRMPDREAAWQGPAKVLWPDFRRHSWFGDWPDIDPDAQPRHPPLSRRQIGDMERAFAWLQAVGDEDRRLIGLALRAKARGVARVPWRRLLAPMGVKRGADGLRMRYGRAMALVCARANADHKSG